MTSTLECVSIITLIFLSYNQQDDHNTDDLNNDHNDDHNYDDHNYDDHDNDDSQNGAIMRGQICLFQLAIHVSQSPWSTTSSDEIFRGHAKVKIFCTSYNCPHSVRNIFSICRIQCFECDW